MSKPVQSQQPSQPSQAAQPSTEQQAPSAVVQQAPTPVENITIETNMQAEEAEDVFFRIARHLADVAEGGGMTPLRDYVSSVVPQDTHDADMFLRTIQRMKMAAESLQNYVHEIVQLRKQS